MRCEDCCYYWREYEFDEETGEMVPIEPRPCCHLWHEEMMGIPAPCEEDPYDRWDCESSRDDWDEEE